MAEELRRFRLITGKPVVAALMEPMATGGAYYLAVGADLVVAHAQRRDRRRQGLGEPLQPQRGDGPAQRHHGVGQVRQPVVDMGSISRRRSPRTASRGVVQGDGRELRRARFQVEGRCPPLGHVGPRDRETVFTTGGQDP